MKSSSIRGSSADDVLSLEEGQSGLVEKYILQSVIEGLCASNFAVDVLTPDACTKLTSVRINKEFEAVENILRINLRCSSGEFRKNGDGRGHAVFLLRPCAF